MRERPRQGYALVFGVLIASRLVAAVVLPVYDDAFITLRMARNLAAGHGLVYQPGEWILSTTSPGYGALMSVPFLLGLPMPATAVAVNILSDAGSLALALLCVPRERRPAIGVLLGTLFSVSPLMGRICVGGMEMNVFILLSMGSVALLLGSRPAAALSLAAVAVSFRPEGVILLLVLLGLVWWKGPRRAAGAATLGAGFVLTCTGAILIRTYGTVLPQSLVAKWGWNPPRFPEVLRTLLAGDPVLAMAIPAAVAAAIIGFRRDDFSRILSLWGLLFVAAYLAARPRMWSWYGAAPGFIVVVLGSVGALAAASMLTRRDWWEHPRAAWAIPPCLAMLAWIGVWALKGPSSVTWQVHRPLARWCADHGRPQDVVAARDIGAYGYYCDSRMLDFTGLVWPAALQYESMKDVLEAHQPDYVFANTMSGYIERLMRTPAVASRYEPVARFSPDGSTGLDPGAVTAAYVPSYLLYRRLPEVAPASEP